MRYSDRGTATLWAIGAIAAVALFVLGGIWLGAATVARHRATSAADLAALAVAARVNTGERSPCARANWVAERMHANIDSCTVRGWEAFVELTVRAGGPLGRLGSASAHARAGPAAPP